MKEITSTKAITFTPQKLHQLKVAYNWAKALGHTQFKFEGHPLLVDYAKYLIEFLENKFGTQPLKKEITTHNGLPN